MGKNLSGNYNDDTELLSSLLRVGKSYDVIVKKTRVGDKRASVFGIGGFIKDAVVEKMLEFFYNLPPDKVKKFKTTAELMEKCIPYIECKKETDADEIVTGILSGAIAMTVEDMGAAAVMIDTRTYPARNVSEPENDKVLRGSHEGFVETLSFNTTLIRRKIRDTNLTFEMFKIGEKSKTDVVLCFVEGKADKKKVDVIRKKLTGIKTKALSMSQESLKESLFPGQWWNPFPKVRYTERPDAASACLCDGNIIVLTDGSPAAMIFPTGVFDFVQDINDYYFTPCVGTFLRYVRMVVFALTLLLVPIWFLLVKSPERIPEWLSFFNITEPTDVPLIAQILIIEFVIDALKLASLNTPSALSNSFSVVGALVLGEFAVSSGLFSNEVVLFMSFVAISNFTQPSYELGYAIKMMRVIILILIWLLDVWGFALGMLLFMLCICFTETIDGYNYLYPLIPFNKDALTEIFVRKSIAKKAKENFDTSKKDAD